VVFVVGEFLAKMTDLVIAMKPMFKIEIKCPFVMRVIHRFGVTGGLGD